MSERSPELAHVLRRAMELMRASFFVCRTGRIEKFDAAKGLAYVKPLQKETIELDTGELSVQALPVIPNVPVFCFGGGDFLDTAPIQVGDTCILLYADRSLDLWKEKGGDVDPIDPRRHDQTDAIALVGLRAKPTALTEWDTSRRVIGKQGGPRVAVSATAVHLGVNHNESATEAVIKGTTYTSDEASALTNTATDITTAGTQLTAAAAAITALALVPVLSGAALAPVATTLAAAGVALNAAAGKLTAFAGGMASRLSTIVKVK